MADEAEPTAEPLFRATKRRKIFRKRNDDDDVNPTTTEASAAASTNSLPDDAEPAISRLRRPVGKKHGITFSSNTTPKQELEPSEDTAMVLAQPDHEQGMVQVDRFVKPTGKAAVVDDRHMMAFVDSKMAEMRSATAAMQSESGNASTHQKDGNAVRDGDTPVANATTTDSAQQPRKNTYQRPRKRQPRPRDPKDVARESLIESIMKETTDASVPLYDRSGTDTVSRETGDADDAAAEAFKAQFMQDMEEQNRRRPNPVPFSKVAQAKGADRTAHGPKLGGSRMQRERMKAAQAAAEAAQKGK
ncbi:hypothetical protein LTR97_003127 [Elasticomyces elasticus]|uniref:Uncharacterized protein n=1 Tax=Elasticomyces elasticus TaxID=574655 RepID=A0AAN8A4A6_9PEZI|nr:hypothetical protein LTR97_003127 [Elasticomyces elasticus]